MIQNVDVSLEIEDSLRHILDSNNELSKDICNEISKGLNKILEILGILSKSNISITDLKKDKILTDRFLRIVVNGHQCRYADELLILVQKYIKCERCEGTI